MDAENTGTNKSLSQGSWVPQTPYKPTVPGPLPIFPDKTGSQMNQSHQLPQPSTSPGSVEATQAASSRVGILNSDSSVDGVLTSATGEDGPSTYFTCGIPVFNATVGQRTNFRSLLDLANAASSVCTAARNGTINEQSIFSIREPTNLQLFENYLNSYALSQGMQGQYTQAMHQRKCRLIFIIYASDKYVIVNYFADGSTAPRDHYELDFCPVNATTKENPELENHKLIGVLDEDSLSAAISTPLKENQDSDKGGSHGIDRGSTPQQKPKRKKHRPKVVIEGKPKRTRVTANPNASKDPTKPKRKYVRKKDVIKTTASQANIEPLAPEAIGSTKRSSRRALDFDNTGQTEDANANLNSKSAEQLEPEGGVKMTTQAEGSHNFNLKLATATIPQDNLSVDTPGTRKAQPSAPSTQNNTIDLISSPNTSNCSTSAVLVVQEEAKMPKRKRGGTKQKDDRTNKNGASYNSVQAYGTAMRILPFPKNCKKRRTEKVQYSASGSSSSLTGTRNFAEFSISYQTTKKNFASDASLEILASTIQPRTCNSNPMNRVGEYNTLCASPRVSSSGNRKNLLGPDICMEALAVETATIIRKKRTKQRTSIGHPSPFRTGISRAQMVLYNPNQYLANPSESPSEANCQQIIIEKMKNLDINKEESQALYDDQKALVLYRREGTIIPFDPIKRRRPRPKVELDEETNRVWRLLLQDINSEGIDGTDEEKTKWWEGEREVFRGRADSFIARMRLVQGNRHFSPWKGSVVDSVVGVFLTQNVSDHLSSSAFMSLAAQFPLKSEINHTSFSDVTTSGELQTPDACGCLSEDTIKWNETMLNQPLCSNQSCMTVYEGKEIVNETSGSISGSDSPTNASKSKLINSPGYGQETSQEFNGLLSTTAPKCPPGDRRTCDDTNSSQSSLASSQNSADPSMDPTERTKSGSEINSETDDTTNRFNFNTNTTSFVELLQMQTLNMPQGFIHGYPNILPKYGISDVLNQSQVRGFEEELNLDKFDPSGNNSSLVRSSSSGHKLHLSPNLGALEVESPYMPTEETRLSAAIMKKDEFCMSEQNEETINLAGQSSAQAMIRATISEGDKGPEENARKSVFPSGNEHVQGSKIAAESSSQQQIEEFPKPQNLPALSSSFQAQYTSALDQPGQIEQKAEESNITEQSHTAVRTSKPRNRGAVKNKKEEIDWDSLRREVEANGKKREKTLNTMDSLDWEAVRCADVKEIADTIKERGMNNMLAERIKAFLNRLVKDHGSIDLEWLRDIPPDKAKEYLLSIRGLGLKSVECVRLLTLHHLAFPVDTNVGRIAVRLGWVPLQPLPESLQLHLLELYPVLESIQKYLWPRLCKLDQRTLYELHYQLITFGKVFCTKSKPNCNACPMRGECRHFASAFASSRLALPGPEEKSIVNVAGTGTHHNPTEVINHTPLPLPQAHVSKEIQQSGEMYRISHSEPIIEEPASPEPECTQALEADIEADIEDAICEDPDDIPTIELNIGEFAQNVQNYMQHMEIQCGEMSKALVALTPEAASIPIPKLKNVNRLRTEHRVYELPDSHPLLHELDKREPDDPCSYLLAIWTPGETADSIQPPNKMCNSQGLNKLCDDQTCFSCNSIREANSQTVRGTLLIPCRTAMRGSFPLNGTYFQVNEVFADHDSSVMPINVPRAWLWNLERRTVYFGTSIPTIFKGFSTEDIQHCFWKGYVCVRGFDRKTRAPRPLIARLHFPASKLPKAKDKRDGKELPSKDNV